jgi:hypothetical protein
MDNFLLKYNTESDFKEFIDDINKNEILMEFAYELYIKFGKKTKQETFMFVNAEILDLEKLIQFFEENGEFEKCEKLVKIKNS